MLKRLTTLLFSVVATSMYAQIPNFAGTCGAGVTNGYTSVKIRPRINNVETYSSLMYGVGEHFSGGIDLSTGPQEAYWGASVRYGNKKCKWFNFGLHATPSFDLNDNFHFSYFTGAIYLVGAITPDENLFWCSNTWLELYKNADNSYTNWEYLGYNINFNDHKSLTPMIGAGHSWLFDDDVDLMGGLYYTYKDWTFYLWGNDYLKKHPRIVFGIEFFL
ncbi:MAG: hypothetical protein MJZ02_05995 [Paludibacteraceae bacterium]|nr:hypothetical protein [Paludibacteraceae bacterium]